VTPRLFSAMMLIAISSAPALADGPAPTAPFVPYQMDWVKMQPVIARAQAAMQTQLQFGSKTWVEASTVNDIVAILQAQENEAADAKAKSDEAAKAKDGKKP